MAPGKRILAVHNETKPEKAWPRERLMQLLDAFLDRYPEFVAFVLDFNRWKGMLHAADLYRLLGVGLFGRANIGFSSKAYNYRQWLFRFSRRRQSSDARGMNYIREARVLAALEDLLN